MEEKRSLEETHVDELLTQALEHGSALLLQAGRVPRVQRSVYREAQGLAYEACKPQHVQSMVYGILSDEQIERFERDLKLAFVHQVRVTRTRRARFLVLVARERGNVAASFLALAPAISRHEPS